MNINEYTSKLIEVINEALKLNCYVRSIDLQKQKVDELETYLAAIHKNKYEAKQRNAPEEYVNVFFHFQCVVNAIISSLQMWIYLKENKSMEAWRKLQDAFDYLYYSKLVKNKIRGIRALENFLKKCEKTLFPPFPLYNSIGMLVKGGECSVCRQPIEYCEHIEGRLYYGTICKRINVKDVAINHVALVKVPEDKRCIITQVEENDGKMHDYMTLLPTNNKTTDKRNKTIEGIIYSYSNLDIF